MQRARRLQLQGQPRHRARTPSPCSLLSPFRDTSAISRTGKTPIRHLCVGEVGRANNRDMRSHRTVARRCGSASSGPFRHIVAARHAFAFRNAAITIRCCGETRA